jgi:SWI/SNF-related matrix-associated actin-dependent regulator of chromatin subfamily A member 5
MASRFVHRDRCAWYTLANMSQNKQLDAVKSKASPASTSTSRASSVASNGSATKAKGKGKKK